jgi:serine/threonine protein kinase
LESFIPKRFGKFFLIDLLGKGGMAGVYLATEIEKFEPYHPYKSFIALKQLFPKYSAQSGFIKCLVDEAKLTSMLKHPNIVEVLDLGNVGTDYYMTMNWVNGKSLYQLLHTVRSKNKVISKAFLFYIFQKVARGLHYAHEMKDSANRPLDMVHCDISPQNILIGYEGEVKLSDFGIATAEKSKEQASNEALLGKLPYMAPEQITLKGFDKRVDIYAFGVLMFEGLTGRKPLDAANIHELQSKIVREIPQFTSKVFQQNEVIREFIASCLEKDPNNRPSSISEFFKLESECEDVDAVKISKLMKLLFQDEIKKEKEVVQAAVQILADMASQEDLLSDEDEHSFLQEKSVFRPTEIMPANAPYEMTKVALNEPEKEQMGKIQVKKKEVIRVIKKKPVEEEWIDAETTQRRNSKELMEEAKKLEEDDPSFGARDINDVFDEEDSEEDAVLVMPKNERTVVDFDESMEKKWNEIQKNLRNKKQTDEAPKNEGPVEFDPEDSLSEIDEPQEEFIPSYPKTGEIIEFTKDPVGKFTEQETREARIQLKVVRKPKSEVEKLQQKNQAGKMEFSHYPTHLSTDKSEDSNKDFFQEISKSKDTELDENKNLPKPRNMLAATGDAITFKVRKRTLIITAIVLLLAFGFATSRIRNPISMINRTSAATTKDVRVINLYISVEEFDNAQEKTSVALWMNPEFQQTFLSPIKAFFEREYLRYTKKQQLPFRFVFAGLEREAPKIPWQGSLFNSYLPFEKFFGIFQISAKANIQDQARMFIHLYARNPNIPNDYPIDYKGDRPIHHGVLYYPMFSESDNEFQLRLAHEMLHMLGAKDLYNNKGLPKYPEGYVEPFKDPLHPQVYGEIMSRTIPQSPSEYIPLSSLDEARIGASTAQQLGWITEEEKNTFYQK